MEKELLKTRFEKIGARVKFERASQRPVVWDTRVIDGENGPFIMQTRRDVDFVIDIRKDKRGEYFQIDAPENLRIQVLDCKPAQKHLLLFATESGGNLRFLCGHDERQWYVAAVPDGDRPASNVEGAKEALKPETVIQEQVRKRVKTGKRNKRKNRSFIRQGEWFFVPVDGFDVNPMMILTNEPISRGLGSKPHIVQELYRTGGESVYVNRQYPLGLTEKQRGELFARDEKARKLNWNAMRRNPDVYARGRVSHPDHKTIELMGWHRVLMNTESRSAASQFMAFLD